MLTRDVYEQYVNNASFLWILRSVVIEQSHYNANDLFELEQRIDAQLDGLMISIDIGWQACEEALELQESGEIFTAMIIAMRSHEVHKIQKVVETGLGNNLTLPGLISAMGWLPNEITTPWTERFLNGKEMSHKYLGLASCSVRRQDPGAILTNILQRDDCLQHEKLYARALRLIGELRRQDCMPAINAAMHDDNDNIRFWANWSAVLLGQRTNIKNLEPFVFKAGAYQDLAIQLAFRVLPVDQAREWISGLSENESQIRAVIKATGILGDPHAINWLISKMQAPMFAKLAGESFSLITGIDFEKYNLQIDAPDNDIEDASIELDQDENLPFPDVAKVEAIWRTRGQNFIIGRRYFMGHPVAPEILKEKLTGGTQRQRHAAAMELALNENDVQLPNTRAKVLAS